MDIQLIVSGWMDSMVKLLPVGYAFGAGMVTAVNPCGFAMLPVYLSLYLGAEDSHYSEQASFLRILRAFGVTAVVTGGFATVFGGVGLLVSIGGSFLMAITPWVAVAVGVLFVLLGLWVLTGHYLSIGFMMRLAAKVGDPRRMSVGGFFLFGVAFGATSLSCALPVFLAVVGGSLITDEFGSGLVPFASFIGGMGSVLLVLTMGIALVKERVVVGTLRRFLPYVQKLSALFIILSGTYIIYYWLSSGILFG